MMQVGPQKRVRIVVVPVFKDLKPSSDQSPGTTPLAYRLRKECKQLLRELSVTVVCANDYYLDDDACSQDVALQVPVKQTSVVTLPPLSVKEAKMVAMACADGTSQMSAQGASMPQAFQASFKSLEQHILAKAPAQNCGHGPLSPLYLSGAVATLFGSSVAPPVITSPTAFPASAAALMDYVLNRLENLFGARVLCEVIQDILDHPEGLKLSEIDGFDAAATNTIAQRRTKHSETAQMQIARALAPLFFAPYWHARPDIEAFDLQALESGKSGGRSSPENGKGPQGQGGGAGPQWWEESGLMKKLVCWFQKAAVCYIWCAKEAWR